MDIADESRFIGLNLYKSRVYFSFFFLFFFFSCNEWIRCYCCVLDGCVFSAMMKIHRELLSIRFHSMHSDDENDVETRILLIFFFCIQQMELTIFFADFRHSSIVRYFYLLSPRLYGDAHNNNYFFLSLFLFRFHKIHFNADWVNSVFCWSVNKVSSELWIVNRFRFICQQQWQNEWNGNWFMGQFYARQFCRIHIFCYCIVLKHMTSSIDTTYNK